MNRLWIRFSILIVGLCLLIIPLWSVLNRLDPVIGADGISFDDDLRLFGLLRELPETLFLVVIIAIILGMLLSRGLSAPIVALSEVAKQIGSGDLRQRVPISNHSQELDDLARSFNRMAAELENAEVVRNNMLADISHELRTPLTVLSGQLHAALDNVVSLDEENLANLYGQTQHLIGLVEDLHLLAQAEAHRLPLEMRTVYLGDVWRELAANFSLVAEEKGVRFQVDGMDDLPPLSADNGRLRQLFSNLLDNAIRHSPPGGEVVVSVRLDDEKIAVVIRDSGEGISDEQLPHLFDRFYRADTSRARNTGGSGLGLAIAKALVETHQGNISVDSAGLNKGSTFTVTLPIQINQNQLS